MKLVLAEKPSVAMSLSKVIGANQRGDGYMDLLAGKRIFGIGRAFHAECTECQMLRGRKNLSMERCYDK